MAHGGSWKTKTNRRGPGVLQMPTFLTPKKVPRFAFANSSFFLAIWSLWMKLKNESLYISSCRPSNNIKKRNQCQCCQGYFFTTVLGACCQITNVQERDLLQSCPQKKKNIVLHSGAVKARKSVVQERSGTSERV